MIERGIEMVLGILRSDEDRSGKFPLTLTEREYEYEIVLEAHIPSQVI